MARIIGRGDALRPNCQRLQSCIPLRCAKVIKASAIATTARAAGHSRAITIISRPDPKACLMARILAWTRDVSSVSV
ncbi:hypothetical protein [Yoonia vestfoldensis]|uniref:hypothetical protein n=1 Tax=Yoonia vestfoldensis TaxID=245188 RepID=UPI0013A575CD|nr:hypothetical protein [Yoonia vestfoldensis]